MINNKNETKIRLMNVMLGVVIGSFLFFIISDFINVNRQASAATQNDSKDIIEANAINPKYFFEGELIPTSNKEGMYKYGGKYLPSAIKYENAVYVPIEFLTKHQNYSLIYDNGDIYLNAPTDEFIYGNDDNFEPSMGEYYDPNKDQFEEDLNFNYGINTKDLSFFNVNPYDNADKALKTLSFKNQKVLKNGNDIFVTDSIGTDTSIFMSIEKNEDNEIIGIDYEDFNMKFKKINQKYKYIQPSFKSSRGITVGSKMSDVLNEYGDNPSLIIEDVDPELDKDGNKTKNSLIKAFKPSLDDSNVSVNMRHKSIPKSSPQNKLLYLTITYEFEGFNSGYLTYYAVVSKNEPMENAVIYGFNYSLYQ